MDTDPAARAAAQFATTHWSVVLAARGAPSAAACQAREQLCRTYWYPLYAFARREGLHPDEAEDAVQAFFERFLDQDYLKDVARERGRFRSFLLAAMRHFLADQRDRALAAKRGGKITFVPLLPEEAEERFVAEPTRAETVERSFDRAWAQAVMRDALRQLGEEHAKAGKSDVFRTLKVFLSRPPRENEYDRVGQRLGLNAHAAAAAVARLRGRYREAVRQTIAHTVATPGEIDEEMRYLVELLTG
jgi:RNA polymerase sigma factor (sigma-70 family)